MTLTDSGIQKAQKYELLDPDVRLMLQVRDDNAGAFEQLVDKYQAHLIAVLEHIMPTKEGAEDLAQEVFMRVYGARKTYAPKAKFSTWLFTIANNVASNAMRKRSRRKEVNIQAPPASDAPPRPLDNMAKDASGLMPARLVDKEEIGDIVRSGIQMLNERQRMALLLSKMQGMSYQEISEVMGITTQAVKSLLSRARINLKAILEPYMHEGKMPSGSGSAADPEISKDPSSDDSEETP